MTRKEEESLNDGRAERIRVVVADDDGEMRKLMALMLRRQGYGVLELSDGGQLHYYLQGLASGAIRVRPEVLVSDIRMPGFTGLQLLEEIRDAELRIPTILVTGFGDATTHQEAKKLGAHAVLDKPFPFGLLREEVRKLAPLGE